MNQRRKKTYRSAMSFPTGMTVVSFFGDMRIEPTTRVGKYFSYEAYLNEVETLKMYEKMYDEDYGKGKEHDKQYDLFHSTNA